MAIPIVCILLGILSTVQLHLAKAMERQGIEVFDQIRAKIKKEAMSPEIAGFKKPVIYIVAQVLNNTIFLYIMLSDMFGPASYFTSMFGVGLVVLMTYSAKVLKEKIQPIEYLGSVILITGTLLLGIDAIFEQNPAATYATMNTNVVWTFFSIMGVAGAGLIAYSYKTGKATGLIFGIFGGFFSCFDPIFKAVGQQLGGTAGILRSTTYGWVFFLISFGASIT
jgi:uncharacterized membrane protein